MIADSSVCWIWELRGDETPSDRVWHKEVVGGDIKRKAAQKSDKKWGFNKAFVVMAAWFAPGADEDRWIWRFKVRLCISQRMLKTASLLSADQLSQQSGQWSYMLIAGYIHSSVSLTNTHKHTHIKPTATSHSIPRCLSQIFQVVPQPVSLIWLTRAPSFHSCLNSHLLCVFPPWLYGAVGLVWCRNTAGEVAQRRKLWMCFA